MAPNQAETPNEGTTTRLIRRLPTEGERARNDLLTHVQGRLLRKVRKIFREDFARLGRWEQTVDVNQGVLRRLNRALEGVPLDNSRHFWRLATKHINWELIELTRRYFGPQGPGANHDSERFGGMLDQVPDERTSLED
jgi:hypothetical protein